MSTYRVRRVAGAMTLTGLTVIALAQPASASNQDWSVPGGRATAHFSDAANRVYISDLKSDGSRGGVASRMNIWRVGNEGGTHVYCPVGNLGSTNCPLIWVEDTHLKGQLCQYPNSTSEYCDAVKEFWS